MFFMIKLDICIATMQFGNRLCKKFLSLADSFILTIF